MEREELIKAAGYWDEKDRNTKKADRDAVYAAAEAIATSFKSSVLATGSGGDVRCTPVDHTFHDGAFWIFSEGGRKFANILENSKVSLAVFDQNGTFGSLRSVQVTGTAEFIELFSEEYNRNAEIRKIPVTSLKKLPCPMYLIKITPTEMIVLDSSFKKQGYSSRGIWRADEK